jgi:hypothetical protein
VYRLDAVHTAGRPGFAATWVGALRVGALDGRIQASAWGLRPGQLAYLGRAGLPGTGAFVTASRGGSELSLTARARLLRRATVAVEWRHSHSGEEHLFAMASLAW